MSSKRSSSILEDSVDSQSDKQDNKEAMPPPNKKMLTVHPLMASIRSIHDEFSQVPNNPIWLTIAFFMGVEECERIFPHIPELKGIERLTDARAASKSARRAIKYNSEAMRKCTYYVEQKYMDKLFPSGIEGFLSALEGYDDWKAEQKRIQEAFAGKDSLYSTTSHYSKLAVSPDENELWFEWGADKSGFRSEEGFNEFCALAGVDPSQPIRQIEIFFGGSSHTRYHWISHDRKVTFTSSNLGSYCHYFGCTGLRSRSKFLLEWFEENGSHDEICWNGRSFI